MKNYLGLTKIFSALLILFFAGTISVTAQKSIYTLQPGTKIRVRMDNEINSKVSSVNDTFTTTVSSPVIVRDVEIIPAGSVIEGRILEIKPASTGNVNGFLYIRFESFKLADDIKRTLDATLLKPDLIAKKSAFSAISIFGGTAIGAILGAITGKAKGAAIGAGIGAGAGTATALLKKGKEARIKANDEFEIRLNKEVTVPARDF